MPKRPRQAHIPRQAVRRRKPGRRDGVSVPSDAYLDVSRAVSVPDGMSRDPVGPIPVAAPAASISTARRSVVVRSGGQLPTFERSYLVEELRRIAVTAASLLALIVVLTIVLR